MTEQRMRRKVIKLLEGIGAFAVENMALPGTPDVCTTAGWIELKLGTWPRLQRSRVRVTLRKVQRIWLRRWHLLGGKAWTLTWIDGEWFLHCGSWSCKNLGLANEKEFRSCAIASWDSTPTAESLIGFLKG